VEVSMMILFINNATSYEWLMPTLWLYKHGADGASADGPSHHEQRVLSPLEVPTIDRALPFALGCGAETEVCSTQLAEHEHWRLCFRGFYVDESVCIYLTAVI
jgi:hypothetical protein